MSASGRRSDRSLEESPHLLEALQVAYYHCVLELPLKRIADLLEKSPATITRRLDEVRKAGWLRDHPEFTPPPEMWRRVHGQMTCADIESALLDHYGRDLIQRMTVIPSPVRGDAAESRTEPVERVGKLASVRLCEALRENAHVVGINWGWTVRHCITSLRPHAPNADLRFVPLVGNLSLDENDPHFEEAIECSSNRLAQVAASTFEGPRAPRLNTPAYIPRRFYGDQQGLRAIRDFIEGDVSYRRIFGGNDAAARPLIDQMDTLITGLSSLDVTNLPAYRPGLITEQDIADLQAAGVEGDVGLHLVVSPEASEGEVSPLVDEVNSLIVGASPEDFRRVAGRHRRSPGAGLGVLVLACGPWKARILNTAIHMGVVNELMTDQETALAMCRLLGVKPAGRLASFGGRS